MTTKKKHPTAGQPQKYTEKCVTYSMYTPLSIKAEVKKHAKKLMRKMLVK